MALRARYNGQLETLHLQLIKMGALSEDAIDAAMKSLFNHDSSMAEKTFSLEKDIDEQEKDIENLCIKLLLEQQPVATDLRMVSSAMRMISDLERIGDLAENIAEITKFIDKDDVISRIPLNSMAEAASDMVAESVESFVRSDVDLAKKVIQSDDNVDEYFVEIKKELMNEIKENSENGEACLDILMISKYLERVADHAVNVAEWVIYAVTGENPKNKE
ncbi:MAG: phosphate signaling complex protein PhoU [Anaerovoracaceae bacterium]|jgi:phosphate transport system protein